MTETFKVKEARRQRIIYWRDKLEKAGLMYDVLDDDITLKKIYREWRESKGKPVIQRNKSEEPIALKETNTTVKEFYKIKHKVTKEEWKLSKDDAWRRGLSDEREEDNKPVHSNQKRAIARGISPLLYDIVSPKTKEYNLSTGCLIKRKDKNKKHWNF